MKKNLLLGTLVVLAPSLAMAHVSVRPRESKPGAEELSASGAATPSNDAAAVEAWLKSYYAAFNAQDLDKRSTFDHTDVTIYEGGGINNRDGTWKIRHSHTSSRARRPQA